MEKGSVLKDIFFSQQPQYRQRPKRDRSSKQTEFRLEEPEQPSSTKQEFNTSQASETAKQNHSTKRITGENPQKPITTKHN